MNNSLWHRLALRPTRTQALIGLLFVALGVLGVMAIRGQSQGSPLQGARNEDLVQVLDDLTSRRDRLEVEARRLEVAQERILAGSDGQALVEAQRRVSGLEILSGVTPVSGAGVTLTIAAGQRGLAAALVLNMIQELRDAGAEAIAVGGVRMVASSWVGDDGDAISISGTKVSLPLIVIAVGEPQTIATALQIPGGIAETIRAGGGSITIDRKDSVQVPALPNVSSAG
ncbi:unannotated protein [freshwater metagenome]|uniref:Unannotated protein n=1 Tax=freshwater metagenome TaxID=449393 RepID=A0A6J7GFH5_9ZZZZ|nr:DUF881 domain-containing protein [Actinomycetota bacterium]